MSHDPSEIIHTIYAELLLKKHFIVVSVLKTVVLRNIFVETVIHFFSGLCDE